MGVCLAFWRFQYFHGLTSARLLKHKTVYANPGLARTYLITLLSPMLFLAPEGYLRELEEKWVDEVIIEEDWRNFIIGLLKEWEQLILLVCYCVTLKLESLRFTLMISQSTVALTVNVGFLAIPGVVISNLNSNITGISQVVIFTSPAEIASCMSIVASAGSIVIGLLLIRHASPQQSADPASVVSEQKRL